MTPRFRPQIFRYDSLASTNTEAARQAVEGAPEGVCIVAREQTAGRGRQQRAWLSPAGAGLYFSTILRPRLEMRAWPLVTLMAALAVHDALVNAYGLATDIKWPNDICAGERKLGGILAETIETAAAGGGRAVILGIGINLSDHAFPPSLSDVAVSVESLTGRPPDVERLLHALTSSIGIRYEMLHAGRGARETIREWSARSSYAEGKRVCVRLGEETFEGVTRGLECDGALRVETDSGEIRAVRAGDVTSLRRAGDGE